MKLKRAANRPSKWFLLSCAFVLSSISAFAQETNNSNKSNIEILKLRWEKQIRLPRNFDPSVIATGGTFSDPASRTSSGTPASSLDAVRAATRAQSAAAGGTTTFPDTPARLPIVYVYSIKIKNAGAKTIEAVAWDYVFIDKNSDRELGRHQFLSYQRVNPGKTATFQSQLRSPPTRIVQASNSHAKRPQFTERAVVQCVLYADDSSWKHHDSALDVCTLLRQNKELLKQGRRDTRSP
ncbi:MAG: hypothetical protein ABR607_11145 [Pyrinomonadaceae bacterium]